ncbi:Ferrochelatase, protoheme ferro-lyase [Acidisarcina polymorpha]|uniref:Ferrochelatase n=1 Tax=Acidisarcina polymorpha TaxID=2211140 RepID=A0A2Z5G1P5_9BACT|nr:ferrochelatase [Acidisarcina polymorpha]AXC12950.1 Ferrochelatase, protoheme ferro-lyase [Acidisarcina polymorpha]
MAEGAARTATGKTAILLLAHGTPETLDDIPAYLRNVVSGRPMPDHVVAEIRHRYSLIGKSPLTELTMLQGQLLSEKLGLPVYVGMRNWKPYIADVVRQMRTDGVTAAAVICLAPQNSRTSVGLYRRAVFAEAGGALDLDFVEGWADHPQLVKAFAERLVPLRQQLAQETGATVPVLFTAHSVPCRTIQTPQAPTSPTAPAERDKILWPPNNAGLPDPYPVDAKTTARLVAEQAGMDESQWFFAFQSQGQSGGPWIGPTVEDTLTSLSSQGCKAIILQTIGFLCDHVEILYDIDISFRQFAAGLGMRLERTESLNGSPILTEALADLSAQSLGRLALRLADPQAQPVPAGS